MIKKIEPPLLLLAFVTGVLVLLGYLGPGFARSPSGPENFDQQPHRPPADSSSLVSAGVFSPLLYLPLIHAPPPPNPKKGVAAVAAPACVDMQTLRASWYLNWGPTPDPTCPIQDRPKFVPRISNGAGMQWLSLALAYAQDSGWLIGFSEPNLPWQGNLTPAQAALLWKQIEDAADPVGIKLVSPSPNQWEPGQNGLPYGHQWLWAMVDEYKILYGHNPRFDAIAWNIYKQTHSETVIYLTARHNEALARGYNVPIWVLEYGGECWNGAGNTGNQAIMTTTTPWFDGTSWIERYAWFANRITPGTDSQGVNYTSCTLLDPASGVLTPLGLLYLTY